MPRRLIQSYKDGSLELLEVPTSSTKPGHVLVRNAASLVSVGTEKAMIELASKSLIGKALERPDLVEKVINKARADGPLEAYRQAMARLDEPVPLGYASSGRVIAVGAGVEGIDPGDRVACSGSGYAGHAEVVNVPANLCAKLPDGVALEQAAFTALGGIAIEAMRLADVRFGETVIVIGLGLLGQIATQLLNSAGCTVIGVDLDSGKVKLALANGAAAATTDYEELERITDARTNGNGADAVFLMATTPSNEPLEHAAQLTRERGHIVATGRVGLDIPRRRFFERELSISVSRAWGPGVFDRQYTDGNTDYPYGHVRWTAKRNMQTFLDRLADGSIELTPLITHRFPFDDAPSAYQTILDGETAYIGVLLEYPEADVQEHRTKLPLDPPARPATGDRVGVGVIGGGTFAKGTMLPLLQDHEGVALVGAATRSGLSSRDVAGKFGFGYAASDHRELLEDPDIELIFILTAHGSHARLAVDALEAGKDVFVEKPLATGYEQLNRLHDALKAHPDQRLMGGFNRRFSPLTTWLNDTLPSGQPKTINCTVNAGQLEPDSWRYDPKEGGGRLISEAGHFIDLMQFFAEARPERVYTQGMSAPNHHRTDNFSLTVRFEDGSVGTLNYHSNGDRAYPRERVEVFSGGAVGVIDNFRKATVTQGGRSSTKRRWLAADRGHAAEVDALVGALRTGAPLPVAPESYLDTTLATFAGDESLRTGQPVNLDWEEIT